MNEDENIGIARASPALHRVIVKLTWIVYKSDNGIMRVTSASTTILLVEDDQTIRELAAAMLAADGYRVLSAATAQDALDVLARHPDVALIFSDVQMPRCDGLSMVRQLRRRGIAIPTLLTSGLHTPDPGTLPPRTGFLPKPYRRADLLAALDRLQTEH
ncbi:response regulator [Xanthomonas sacchari]|uniref:response regulator n=1 Tax=Xanthomonas sacchari TaxID=56458 RepID=UPI003B2280DB